MVLRQPFRVQEEGVEWEMKALGNNILTSLAHNQSIRSSLILKRQKGEELFMFKMGNQFIVSLSLLISFPIVLWVAVTNKSEVWFF
jgi:hypothetical protein